MQNSILKEHKTHAFSWILPIMLCQVLSKFLWQGFNIINFNVFSMHIIIVPEQYFFYFLVFPFNLEIVLQIPLNNIEEPSSFFFFHQPIKEDSLGFVHPKTDKGFFVGQVFILDLQNSLEDLAQVTKIESVVGFCGSWQQLCSDLSVHLQG